MKTTVILLATLLSACANQQTMQYRRTGNPQDVRYCEYEASKVQVGQFAARSAMMQGYEQALYQNEIFNKCMAYRSGQ